MRAGQPMVGPGYFQWNRGGWLGSQVGSTLWLLLGAVVLTPRAPTVAVAWAAYFAVANAVGVGLWWRRDRVSPYPAMLSLFTAIGLCGWLAWLTLDVLGPGAVAPVDPPDRGYLAILIVPALMAWFTLLEHTTRARLRSLERAPDGPSVD